MGDVNESGCGFFLEMPSLSASSPTPTHSASPKPPFSASPSFSPSPSPFDSCDQSFDLEDPDTNTNPIEIAHDPVISSNTVFISKKRFAELELLEKNFHEIIAKAILESKDK